MLFLLGRGLRQGKNACKNADCYSQDNRRFNKILFHFCFFIKLVYK